jgi:cation diffusion facilitator family transporter
LIQSGLVFASAVGIGWEAIQHMLHPAVLTHETFALVIMAASLVLTGVLVAAQTRVLRQAASVAVAADRTHYLADIASNLAALAGIAAAALLHAAWIDALAGFIVAAWLFFGAGHVFRGAADQLLDRELSDEARSSIRDLVAQDPAVLHVHALRTRASGPYVHIQLHLALAPSTTLDRAHRIVVAAERRLLEVYPAADILIHADPDGQAEPHGGAFAKSMEGQETAQETAG